MLRAYCVGFMHIFDPAGESGGTRLHQVDLKRYQVAPKCSDYHLSTVPEGIALRDDNPAELIYTAAGYMSEKNGAGLSRQTR